MKVIISLPALDYMATDCATAAMGMAVWMYANPKLAVDHLGRPIKLGLAVKKGSTIPSARRDLVQAAIDADATHIFFLDTDVSVPADTIPRLARHNVDIVCASYVRRYGDDTDDPPVIGIRLDPGPAHPRLTPMATIPLGCCLIRLSIFAKLPQPWFSYSFRGDDGFQQVGEDRSEDTHFCNIARGAGIVPWLDPMLTHDVGHVESKALKTKRPTPKPPTNHTTTKNSSP